MRHSAAPVGNDDAYTKELARPDNGREPIKLTYDRGCCTEQSFQQDVSGMMSSSVVFVGSQLIPTLW
ncbi:hypothetical protein [Paenibacillus marinisediminis]